MKETMGYNETKDKEIWNCVYNPKYIWAL